MPQPSNPPSEEGEGDRRTWFDDINVVALTGNLMRPPQLRHLADDTPVAEFLVASTATRREDGRFVRHTNKIYVHVYGKYAQVCCTYLRKGSRVGVEGKYRYREWSDRRDGSQRSGVHIIGGLVAFLDRAPGAPTEVRGEEPPAEAPAPPSAQAQRTGLSTGGESAISDCDVLSEFGLPSS